ncbi:mitochondrial ribosomal protein S9 [Tachypleus tridentatus]|uniref:mitochondrial ribosomal protein S9 n=1 Tax=Tachypleus tridentatus TaxID=6853 RepID=UPI003FD3C049
MMALCKHTRTGFAFIKNFKSEVFYRSNVKSVCRLPVLAVHSHTIPSVLQTEGQQVGASSVKVKKISKAMRAYLERAKEHDEFMKHKREEYEFGKRHLANMMGVDPEHFTQADIDQAIEYLMPSGLFEKKARPIMKPPEQIFPKRKAAEFDESGRPFHFLFYTGKANFFQTLHDIVEKIEEVNSFEDRMLRKGIREPPAESRVNLSGSTWVTKEGLEELIIEKTSDQDYATFVSAITNLADHPYSYRVKDYIMKFRMTLTAASLKLEILPLQYDANNHPFVKTTGYRKTSKAEVLVQGNGTGKIEINGTDIEYFENIQDREQLIFPLQFSGLLKQVDVSAVVSGGGTSGQAGAIRHGLSLALCSFLSPKEVELMRLAGLLTRDRRTRERKKPGQAGARKKFTWKKR